MPVCGIGERLVYIRPDGSRYNLHAPPSRVVMSEEGLGTPPLEYITDRAPFQHGDTVRAILANPRPIQLVVLHNFESRAAYRDGRTLLLDAVRVNRPGQPGKLLYYLANGRRRQLDVFLESGPGFAPDQPGWRAWSFIEVLRFVAHDPIWYDPTLHTQSFGQLDPHLQFPATFPIQFSGFSTAVPLSYAGSWEEYPTIKVSGPIGGFFIANLTTGARIRLDTTINVGVQATIVLRGIKSLLDSNGTNLFRYLSNDSDLTRFALLPGINLLQAGGHGVGAGTSIVLEWYDRYFGI